MPRWRQYPELRATAVNTNRSRKLWLQPSRAIDHKRTTVSGMVKDRIEVRERHPLEVLGIGEAEERVYRYLLAHPGATVAEIARTLVQPTSKAQRLLDAIESKGLTTHAPERPRRYIPTSPDIGMEALIVQRQNDLRIARGVVQEMQKQAAEAQTGGEREQVVELITSPEAERQIFDQILRTTQREIIFLIRPPIRVTNMNVPTEYESLQKEGQGRGVRYRSIIDAEFLDLPGAVQRIRNDIKTGEVVKVLPSLPLKLVLSDRRVALIPLHLGQAESPSLLVRSSTLLETLYTLFEILWERAAPLSFATADVLETGAQRPSLPQGDYDMIRLLASGLNDKTIAYELDVSVRTFRRRIGDLMRNLDARTRFQAGWVAALRLLKTHTD